MARPAKWRPWTAEEDALLALAFPTEAALAWIAGRIGRSVDAVGRHAYLKGLHREYRPAPPALAALPGFAVEAPRDRGQPRGALRRWTEADDAYLRQVFGTPISVAAIAGHLKRTANGVYSRATNLGLCRGGGVSAEEGEFAGAARYTHGDILHRAIGLAPLAVPFRPTTLAEVLAAFEAAGHPVEALGDGTYRTTGGRTRTGPQLVGTLNNLLARSTSRVMPTFYLEGV